MHKHVPAIDPARCTGCGRCVAACPTHVLSLQPHGWVKAAVLDTPADCTGCGQCKPVCPFDALRMVRTTPHKASAVCLAKTPA